MTRVRRAMPRAPMAGVLALLLAVLAACATGGAVSEADPLEVRVKNNLVPPSSLTISLVPETGPPRLLGVVGASETKVLRLEGEPPALQYRLVAETTNGTDISSRPVLFGSVDLLEWDLALNTVRVIE